MGGAVRAIGNAVSTVTQPFKAAVNTAANAVSHVPVVGSSLAGTVKASGGLITQNPQQFADNVKQATAPIQGALQSPAGQVVAGSFGIPDLSGSIPAMPDLSGMLSQIESITGNKNPIAAIPSNPANLGPYSFTAAPDSGAGMFPAASGDATMIILLAGAALALFLLRKKL